ncbi:GNAT family N-acetyltransferase [Nocardioides sp.]|uniref:GNAT family N-acetyltransferase n=1 Tax=Nocardioides sp. TaxID=35761 RepID=UPI0035B3B964
MSAGIEVRCVAFDDLPLRLAYDLWRLRQQVFVVEQECPYPDLDGRDLEKATRHVLLLEYGLLVGCLRVLDDGERARIGRVVVASQARGRGLAHRLMDRGLQECGDREVHLDVQTGMTDFYRGHGFEVTGPEFDEDGILHVPMARPGTTVQ